MNRLTHLCVGWSAATASVVLVEPPRDLTPELLARLDADPNVIGFQMACDPLPRSEDERAADLAG